PSPVSLTAISNSLPACRTFTTTLPPFGVNFTELDSRFQTICWRRAGSAEGAGNGRSVSSLRVICFASADGRIVSIVAMTIWTASIVSRCICKLTGNDLRNIQEILDQLGLNSEVAIDHLQCFRSYLWISSAVLQHLYPAEHGG